MTEVSLTFVVMWCALGFSISDSVVSTVTNFALFVLFCFAAPAAFDEDVDSEMRSWQVEIVVLWIIWLLAEEEEGGVLEEWWRSLFLGAFCFAHVGTVEAFFSCFVAVEVSFIQSFLDFVFVFLQPLGLPALIFLCQVSSLWVFFYYFTLLVLRY